MSICPDGNLLNKFIKEKLENIVLTFGKNHIAIKNTNVMTPAIIWFSVKLDANIPKDIYAAAKIRNPNIETSAVCKCGDPK